MNSLQNQWERLCKKYCKDKALIQRFWQEIEESYSGPRRFYHNLDHLTFMIKLAQTHRELVQDFDVLLFSIFYHDIVYSSLRKDNEARSAALAKNRMEALGVPKAKIQHCQAQILATRTHAATGDPDTDFLLDIDLGVLAEKPARYREYGKQIRREYARYPDFLYNKGRKEFLSSLLKHPNLFHTLVFQERMEEQARINIQDEIALL